MIYGNLPKNMQMHLPHILQLLRHISHFAFRKFEHCAQQKQPPIFSPLFVSMQNCFIL